MLAAEDVRSQVAEDAVLAYLALDREQMQRAALLEETGYAQRLETIVKDRLDAGQDSAMEYTKARRTNVQLRLQLLQLDDQIAVDRDHLTRIVGLPSTKLEVIDSSIPTAASTGVQVDTMGVAEIDSPAIRAAAANAQAKRQQAFGDARFLYRPQLGFGASYNRFSTYNNNYGTYYPGIVSEPNALGFEVSITLPVLDKVRQAKARETMAEAVHAEQQVQIDRQQFFEGRLKIRHNIAELQAKAELASLDRDLAQEQLDVILVQLQSNSAGGQPITPKDEQNARIAERQRTIDMLDAEFQLRQAEVSLLRQTGGLADWLKQAGLLGSGQPSPLPPAPAPVPH
jgi:outer membrane protein TolC